jgi:hypothetical protein
MAIGQALARSAESDPEQQRLVETPATKKRASSRVDFSDA